MFCWTPEVQRKKYLWGKKQVHLTFVSLCGKKIGELCSGLSEGSDWVVGKHDLEPYEKNNLPETSDGVFLCWLFVVTKVNLVIHSVTISKFSSQTALQSLLLQWGRNTSDKVTRERSSHFLVTGAIVQAFACHKRCIMVALESEMESVFPGLLFVSNWIQL